MPKTSRRSISIRGTTYRRITDHVKTLAVEGKKPPSVSGWLEDVIARELSALGVVESGEPPEILHPQKSSICRRADHVARASQHFSF